MEYKGYVANITYDDELESFFGQVANTLDVITFYGKSVDELKREFALSVEAHLAYCAEQGIEPSQPR
jgi:predicted HicB family RNase H-like nuclease